MDDGDDDGDDGDRIDERVGKMLHDGVVEPVRRLDDLFTGDYSVPRSMNLSPCDFSRFAVAALSVIAPQSNMVISTSDQS